MVLEEDAHLRNLCLASGGYLEGTDDVLTAVGAQHAQGQLAAGEDDGFGKVFEHEAQRRSGVGHGVGAMEHDEAVVALVFALDDVGNVDPQGGRHV